MFGMMAWYYLWDQLSAWSYLVLHSTCIALDLLTQGEQGPDPIGYPSPADSTATSTDKENHLGQR